MAYKTYRGRTIDLEAIRRKNEGTVAVGNMGVNARGDKLGPGGEIISPVQHRARMHHTNTTVSTETVSIKGDMPADEAGVLEEKPAKKTSKTKIAVKEQQTDSGDIIIEDDADES